MAASEVRTANPLQLSSACFQHPRLRGEMTVSAMPMPDDLMRLKAEYFERTNGRGDGYGRGRECFGYVFPR